MGRGRTFDDQDVVRAARRVFWERGYAETGISDLEQATGLRRSSLYHAYGSKRGLFDAACESYLDDVIRPRLAPLVEQPVAPEALENYLTGLRTALQGGLAELHHHGCLLMNATAASIGQDDAMKAVISRYHEQLRASIGAGVRARRPELSKREAALLTTTCTSLVLTSMISVRISPATAVDMVTSALHLVEGQFDPAPDTTRGGAALERTTNSVATSGN